MTTEQAIVLGFIAAAFLFGWLARAATEWAGRRRGRAEAAAHLSQRSDTAAHEGRRELDRAIRAYHATVARSLEDEPATVEAGGGTLDPLAHALYALSLAVGHASGEVEQDDPLAERLRRSGAELRRLAQDVMAYSSEPEIPNGVLDQLEELLMSAASTLLVPTEARPA